MFQPILINGGYAGWNFLQSTYDRQIENFSNSPQIKRDLDYFTEKMSQPMTQAEFVEDARLRRVALTAFDLDGEAWKKGFIDKVLTESVDPESNFLPRLNNAAYTAFADDFRPVNGTIELSPEKVAEIAENYRQAAFRLAVGESDNSMRLALNFEANVGDLVGTGTNEEASLYRILGNVPVRSVLETALNLPAEFRKIPLEKQAEMLSSAMESRLGIRDIADLKNADVQERVIQRYFLMEQVNTQSVSGSGASIALTLLGGAGGSGLGSTGIENLFLSRFL